MNLVEWFEQGLTPEQYINGMNVNKEGLETILHKFAVPVEDEAFFAKLQAENLRVVVLTEDWCGDAMLNVPILLKLAEKTGMEVRMVLRDQNLELMDQYLTNGTARSIPIFIFIDQEGNESAVWGPRAPKLQQYVMDERAQLPDKEDPTFADKQTELYKQIMHRNTVDETFWNEVYQSLKEKLQ